MIPAYACFHTIRYVDLRDLDVSFVSWLTMPDYQYPTPIKISNLRAACYRDICLVGLLHAFSFSRDVKVKSSRDLEVKRPRNLEI